MIVAVLGEKGGTGKTMVATNLAGMRAAAGRKILLIDADRQGSAQRWAKIREAEGLAQVDCEPLAGDALRRYLHTRISRYDDVVVDVGAGDGDEMEIALLMAECVVVPVRPTAADVWTMTLVDGRIAAASGRNRGLRAWALINQVSPNPRHTAAAETREVLKSGCAFMSVAEPVLCDRVAFQRAYSEGRTVEEYGSRSEKAAAEMAALYSVAYGCEYAPSDAGQAA